MGKLYNDLQRQANIPEHKIDADDCIRIYEELKKMYGSVWSSPWEVLTEVEFKGTYPNSIRIHKPSAIGRIFLKGIRN